MFLGLCFFAVFCFINHRSEGGGGLAGADQSAAAKAMLEAAATGAAWVPVETDGHVGHLAQIKKATTWRDCKSTLQCKSVVMCVAFDNIQCYAGIGGYLAPEDAYAMAC